MSKTYVMKAGKLHKIGRSNSPSCRLKNLKTANPNIELLLICNEEEVSEKTLHMMFVGKRRGNEWFELSEADISVLSGFMKKPETKKDKKDGEIEGERVSFYARIGKDVHTNLKLFAGIQGVSMSSVVNKMLKDNLPRVEGPVIKGD